MKRYCVTVPIHGHITFSGIEASSEKEAYEKAMERYHNSPADKDGWDLCEWETGYPCHTGWPAFEASEEKQ